MLPEICFQTMDGKPITICGLPMKILNPQFHWGFWGWAYRCFTQIAMLTADFNSHHSPGVLHCKTYYPGVLIWSGTGNNTTAFTLLRSYEEKIFGVPQFCLCSLNIRVFTNDNYENDVQQQINCGPFLVQFISESHEELLLYNLEETVGCLDNGVSIQPRNVDTSLHDREEFMFDNSEISISVNFLDRFYSPELMPIIGNWKSFFSKIKNEIGILAQPSPVISHCSSPAELYNKIITKTDLGQCMPTVRK